MMTPKELRRRDRQTTWAANIFVGSALFSMLLLPVFLCGQARTAADLERQAATREDGQRAAIRKLDQFLAGSPGAAEAVKSCAAFKSEALPAATRAACDTKRDELAVQEFPGDAVKIRAALKDVAAQIRKKDVGLALLAMRAPEALLAKVKGTSVERQPVFAKVSQEVAAAQQQIQALRAKVELQRDEDSRRELARSMEYEVLRHGTEIDIRAVGEGARTLWMRTIRCSRAFLVQLMDDADHPYESALHVAALKAKGFRKIVCSDGYGMEVVSKL